MTAVSVSCVNARAASSHKAKIPSSNGHVMHRNVHKSLINAAAFINIYDEETQGLLSPSSSDKDGHGALDHDVDLDIDTKSMSIRGGDAAPVVGMQDKLKIGFYFGLWYALNVIYNSK